MYLVSDAQRRLYLFRRPRSTSSAPESSAKAVTAEAGLISGTVFMEATATPDTPIKSNIIPTSFVTFESSPM